MNTEYVDLGLPSGTLWAKCNLGAEKESNFGHFYQWGDTKGYSGVDEHQFNWDDYKWGTSWDNITKYNVSDCKSVLDNEDDPVFAATNGMFKLPTKEQLRELINCTNHEWTNIDGVRGMKFWKKDTEEPTDGKSYIFIPAAGGCGNGSHGGVGSWGSVWSASRDESGEYNAWVMYFEEEDVELYYSSRCYGRSVRGVVVPQSKVFDEIDDTDDGQPVDLGLPSGIKWMKSNIGATKPSDFSKFFQWGDTQGYSGVDEHQFNWNDYKWGTSSSLTKYNNTDGKTTLEASDDAAAAATSGQASMPTKAQLEELRDNTEHRWLRLANGVNGMKFWKKGMEEPTDGNSYIFIPAAGNCFDGSHFGVGSWGNVWSASRDESGAYGAWYMNFNAGYVGMSSFYRCSGFSVRAVVIPQTETFDEIDDTDDGQPVDLGLPSGTLWAKCNLGAEKETDFGNFYQWGDTHGYSGVDEHQFNWNDYKYGSWKKLTKYNKSDKKLILDNEDDPIFVATKEVFKLPTKEQLQELIDHTNHEWTSINGVNGMKFINKNDDTKYIFIPGAGHCFDGIRGIIGSWGHVWSASHGESGSYNAWYMYFNAGYVGMNDASRCLGFTVRGVINSKNSHNTFTKPKEVTTEKCQVDNSEKTSIDKTIYNQLVRLGIIDSSVRVDNQGNSDYAKHIIQPWSIWIDWELNAWDADIVKRVLRTKDGEPRELDYRKIIHVCNERIRQLKNGMK